MVSAGFGWFRVVSCFINSVDLVGFDKIQERQTFLSCYFRIFKHRTMDLEHLHPANNMNRLWLSANLPAVKGLIQSASPLNNCFIVETQD